MAHVPTAFEADVDYHIERVTAVVGARIEGEVDFEEEGDIPGAPALGHWAEAKEFLLDNGFVVDWAAERTTH